MLYMTELRMMRDEMNSKIHRVSSDMVTALQRRDVILVEVDAKNRFIAALLKVKDRKHAMETGVSAERARGRNRSLSLNVNLSWSKLRHRSSGEENKSSDMVGQIAVQVTILCGCVADVLQATHWTELLSRAVGGYHQHSSTIDYLRFDHSRLVQRGGFCVREGCIGRWI